MNKFSNSNKHIISIALILSPFIILVSCRLQKAEWKGTVEEVDGVMVVKNPKEPIYGEDVFELEEELSIGEAKGTEEYMFSLVGSIDVDDEERIYVSDWKESHIKVFTRNGKYLMTIGRKGQGPGEFERVTEIKIISPNELMVFDGKSRRLSYFSHDGKLNKSKSLAEIQILDLKINSKRNFILSSVRLHQVNEETAVSYTDLRIYDEDLNLITTFASSKPTDIFTPFLPFLVWGLTANDNIVYGFNKTYEFQVLSPDGRVQKKITKEYEPVKITDKERENRLKRLEQPLDKEAPRFHPAYRRFSFDDEGRIFVQTWERSKDGEGYYHDVFDLDGKYIAKIPFKFPPHLWKKNKLYIIEEDVEGYQIVKRYKVTWKI